MSKPRLLCIEGPAGSGKSTLCAALYTHCKELSLDAQMVSEFSPTPLGRELSEMLVRFPEMPTSRPVMQDLMFCVADKFSSLLNLPETPSNISVLDRGFITQAVLALPYIEDQAGVSFATSLISLCNEWLLSCYKVTTLVLQLPEFENFRRLEQRLGHALTLTEQQVMRLEMERYATLDVHPDAARIGLQMLDATAAPETLASAILSELLTTRHNE